MSLKRSIYIAFSFLIFFWAQLTECAPANMPNILTLDDNKLKEIPIRAEFVLRIGSDKPNEDFYRLPTFAAGRNGQIYILDSGNSRILCFSREGNFLFKFGRQGQGPGELSRAAVKIKIFSDGNIYVIDNPQRRINVYNQDGKFLYSAKTSVWYNDIELLNNTYYLSSVILKEDHKPIHVCRTLGKIDAEFGILVEPAVGILKRISQLPMPEPWRYYYGDVNFARIVATSRGEIIYSQGYPYRLIKYDIKGNVLKDIMGEVDFNTYHDVRYEVDKLSTSIITYPPDVAWILLDISIQNDNQLVVPFFNPDKNILYFDVYDLDLNLLRRYKLLDTIAELKKGEYIMQTLVDNDNYLYAMVICKEDYPKLVKYRLLFE